MHNGKPWTGEGFPPDDPQAVAVRGMDADLPVCTCAAHEYEDGRTGWQEEGHAPTCPCRSGNAVKSVTGGAGDSVSCTCGLEWKGEGHAKTCAKRASGVDACTCRALKWDGEGHAPECATRQAPEAKLEAKAEKTKKAR